MTEINKAEVTYAAACIREGIGKIQSLMKTGGKEFVKPCVREFRIKFNELSEELKQLEEKDNENN